MKPCDTMQKLGGTQLCLGTNQLARNESVQTKAVSKPLPLSAPLERPGARQKKRDIVWDIKAESEKGSKKSEPAEHRYIRLLDRQSSFPRFLMLHHHLHCNWPWADACHILPTLHKGPEHTHRSDITPISLWSYFRLLYLGLMWWEERKKEWEKCVLGGETDCSDSEEWWCEIDIQKKTEKERPIRKGG